MTNWLRDVRYGLRMLAKNKSFTAVAVLALAFGIGPNVAIFSIAWAVFLAPLPYPHADQLVVVWTKVKGERNPTRANDYLQYLGQSKSFQRLDFGPWDTPLHLTNAEHEQEEALAGALVSPGQYTQTLGMRMAMGRDLIASDAVAGNDKVVAITHRLWQERFHADPDILGKQVLINDEPHTVVGVYAEGVADRIPAKFLVPNVLAPGGENRHWGGIMGRLKPGVTPAQAQAELAVIDRHLAATRGGDLPKEAWTVSVEPLKNDWLDKKLERNLWLLLAAVGFVLLIACANLANLLLARGASRQQELAVRSAMGATRRQVFLQLLTESLTLSALGGVIGILLGWGLLRLIMSSLLDLTLQTAEAVIGMNIPVLCFAVGITTLAGILAGCAPAWRASKLNLGEILKQNSRSMSSGGRRMHTQQFLVIGEFGLALTLLAGAGMALHSFYNLTHIDLGVRTDHVLLGRMQAPRQTAETSNTPANNDQVTANARLLLSRLDALPEIQSATLATSMPLEGHDAFPFQIAGHPVSATNQPVADFESVTPSYFQTFGVQRVRGRLLAESDQAGSTPVIVVSQSFVEKYLQGMDPLDQQILLTPYAAGQQTGTPFALQIVGVFHGVRNGEKLNDEAAPEMFVSYWQSPWPHAELAVRTSLDPGLVTRSVRQTVSAAMPGYTLVDIATLQHTVDTQLSSDRFGMVLFGGFALVALILAALGIYGVMAFAVVQRKHEIGLRMALGAQCRDAVLLILTDGMKLALYGVGLGLVGVVTLGLLMRSMLFGIHAVDLGSFAIVAALLIAVALLASYIPARRCAKVDPMIALRQE